MQFLKTRLLVTLVVACLSLVFFASPVSAATVSPSTHQTAVHPLSHQANPLASGGGCTPANPAVEPCISINSSRLVIPDAYVNRSLGCPREVDIAVYWYTGSSYQNIYAVVGTGSCVLGHFTGHAVPIFSNALYYFTDAFARYSDGSYDENWSPDQFL